MNQNRNLGCASAHPLLAAFARKELTDEEATAVRRHIDACPPCAAHVKFEIHLAGRVRELRDVEVPKRLEKRVQSILSTS